MSLSFFRDCFTRVCERKRILLFVGIFFLIGFILGISFVRTPAFYDYQLNICDRYLYRICFSDRSVFLIFLERTAGCGVLVAVVLFSGIHILGCVVPPAILLYRSYTFGGTVFILFGVYGVSGAIVALVLFLPIHIMVDVVLIAATSVSFGRCRRFRFMKEDFMELLCDALAFFLVVTAVCILESILLLAIFHPLGNLL